jgi:hypothetical protein
MEGVDVRRHHLADHLLRRIHQQPVQRQHAGEQVVLIDHEQLVGLRRQFVPPPQVAQHHFQADVLADGDHLEVHQRAELVVLIGQCRLHLLALLGVQAGHQLRQHCRGQILDQVGQFVRVQRLDRGEDLMAIHVRDQRFAYRVGHLQQDFAVIIGFDQLPDREALIQRQ